MIFLLSLQKFKQLYFGNSFFYSQNIMYRDGFKYKFYIRHMRRIRLKFEDKKTSHLS